MNPPEDHMPHCFSSHAGFASARATFAAAIETLSPPRHCQWGTPFGAVPRIALLLVCVAAARSPAADLIVELKNASNVNFVGVLNRWDADGNHRAPVNPKAKIDHPAVTATAIKADNGTWRFKDLPKGRYDLVILADKRIRIEGFHYPPVLEFDPFIAHGKVPPKSDVRWIKDDIAKARHYENKVTPLYLAGDNKQVRVLVQLLRDKPTSFDAQFGEPVATLRHEVWQYTNRYGGWAKEKRTKVLDRILTSKRELRTWTWVWEPNLGGIEMAGKTFTVTYGLPAKFEAMAARGLLPY